MLRRAHRDKFDRLRDTCIVVEMQNPERLAFALESKWVQGAEDLQLVIDHALKAEVGPDIMAQLLDAKQRLTGDLPKAPDHALCLDPEPETEWRTAPCAGGVRILRYLGAERHVVIPSAVNGKTVVKLHKDMLNPDHADSVSEADAMRRIKTLTIPGTIRAVPSFFVSENTGLQRLVLEDGVEKIGEYAFSWQNSLSEVRLPKTLRSIGSRSFIYCRALTKVSGLCPGIQLGKKVFDGCGSEKIESKVSRIRKKARYDARSANGLDACVAYAQSKGQSGRFDRLDPLFDCIDGGDLQTFDTLLRKGHAKDAYDFALLIQYAESSENSDRFADCLKKQRAKQRLLKTSNIAPSDCWFWEVLPDDSLRLTSYEGFDRDVVIPSEIGDAHVSCLSTDIFDPDAATTLRLGALRKKIRSISVPGSIRHVPRHLARNCSSLREVHFGEGVESIGWGAFEDCLSLEKVQFPASLRSIDSYAFSGCRWLHAITGLRNTAYVGECAFRDVPGRPDARGLVVLGDRICSVHNVNTRSALDIGSRVQFDLEMPFRIPAIIFRSGTGTLAAEEPAIPSQCVPGDKLTLGRFPQNRSLVPESIEWVCLAREDRRILLTTKKIILSVSSDLMLSSDAESWLNSVFAPTALTKAELALLADEGMFLPTVEQVLDLLPDASSRTCKETEYAAAQRAAQYPPDTRSPSWMTSTRNGRNRTVVDSRYGMLREDDGDDLRSGASSFDAPFGIRPWVWAAISDART